MYFISPFVKRPLLVFGLYAGYNYFALVHHLQHYRGTNLAGVAYLRRLERIPPGSCAVGSQHETKRLSSLVEQFSKEISEKRKKELVQIQVIGNKVMIAPPRVRA